MREDGFFLFKYLKAKLIIMNTDPHKTNQSEFTNSFLCFSRWETRTLNYIDVGSDCLHASCGWNNTCDEWCLPPDFSLLHHVYARYVRNDCYTVLRERDVQQGTRGWRDGGMGTKVSFLTENKLFWEYSLNFLPMFVWGN